MIKQLNIAMTASIGEEYQTIWGSGITQNIFFLYQLFAKSEAVDNIYLLDLLQEPFEQKKEIIIGHNRYTCINKEFASDNIDVLIEIGTQVWPEIAADIRARGGKIISMRCGNAYIDEVMGIFSDRTALNPINGVNYDEIWVLPHYGINSAPMLRTLYRCPVKVVNYIWDPEFIHLAAEKYNVDYQYNPDSITNSGKKIATCEPNLNPTKTFHIPLLACEEVYRQDSSLIKHVYAMNTWGLNTNQSLLHFVNRLDLFKAGLTSFESRVDIVSMMKNTAEVIVSHHWQNGLNNLHFDILYGGYPLIHNSEFISEYGYYYETFSPQDAARQLTKAIKHHDENLAQYKEHNKQLFAQYTLHNPSNIRFYGDLLVGLFSDIDAYA
jgi:Protein of unknown function (DUF2827)